MRNLMIAALLAAGVATPASAMTYFLVRDWYANGNHMCAYGNGTVLNVGYRICPLSIEG